MIKFHWICDKGEIRITNQDAVLARTQDNYGLFLVADGMGGHQNGEKASACLVERFDAWWDIYAVNGCTGTLKDMVEEAKKVLHQINQEIYSTYNQDAICGSTLALLLIHKNSYARISVGDSRIYTMQNRQLIQLTVDDTWENKAEVAYPAWRMKKHPLYGKLTRAVGIGEQLEVNIATEQIVEQQMFLLCSDGLYKYCARYQIKKHLYKAMQTMNLQEQAEMLYRLALKKSSDNISIILVRI